MICIDLEMDCTTLLYSLHLSLNIRLTINEYGNMISFDVSAGRCLMIFAFLPQPLCLTHFMRLTGPTGVIQRFTELWFNSSFLITLVTWIPLQIIFVFLVIEIL